MSHAETLQFPCYDPVIATSPEDFFKVPGETQPQQAIDDAETERLLGMPLPQSRIMPTAYERELIEQVATGDAQATLEYLAARARTVYKVVSKIPETDGLTIEDYFQIGCETALSGAVEQFEGIKGPITQYLHKAIGNAVTKKIHAEWSAEPLSEAIDLVEPGDHVNNMAREIDRRAVRFAVGRLAQLRYRHRRVMELRWGLFGGDLLTLDKVARDPELSVPHKVTRERVRQIETGALQKLQHIIPEKHFLRVPLPLEDGRPSDKEMHIARRQQEKAAHEIQKQRDRRAVEDLLIARSPIRDPERLTRQAMLISGLAETVLDLLQAREPYLRDYSLSLESLRGGLSLATGYGYSVIRKDELAQSLNALSDRGLINWVQPENSTEHHIQSARW